MIKIPIDSIERLPEAAAQFIKAVAPGMDERKRSGNNIFAFYGPLGAGKTTFIAEVNRQLESFDEANSPTFSIINEYETAKWGKIYHLDCYRIDSDEEALDIGVEEVFQSGSPCFVEWPEKIEGLIPEGAVKVNVCANEDGSRLITADIP